MSGLRRKYQRRLPDDRRRALVEAALRSLARDGQEGLSIRRIAAEAGVSVGLINHHFPSRIALVAEAYRFLHGRLADTFEAAIHEAPPKARARLSAYFRASFSPPNLDPDVLHVWINFWSLSRSTSEIRAVREETYAAALAVLEGLIGEAMGGAAAASTPPIRHPEEGRDPCASPHGRRADSDAGLLRHDVAGGSVGGVGPLGPGGVDADRRGQRGPAPRQSPRQLAIGLTALLDGLWLEWCLNPATFQPEEGIALCEAWVDGSLRRRG